MNLIAASIPVRTRSLPLAFAVLFTVAAPIAAQSPTMGHGVLTEERTGVLVMAHGGSEEWNASVRSAVDGLDAERPTTVAFGMAEPMSLTSGLARLAERGVTRVAVVRLFLSGRSFRSQTDWLLGLSDERPRWLMTRKGVDPSTVGRIPHGMTIATHDDGLMGSPHAGRIVEERVVGASLDPASESVLLIAHGMGDENENTEVIASMERIAGRLDAAGFSSVRTETLREDWKEAREIAEERIRDFVAVESDRGQRVIVVPFRLSGFGPYAKVLDGLSYEPTEGLLPHEAITEWIADMADVVICAQEWDGCSTDGPDER